MFALSLRVDFNKTVAVTVLVKKKPVVNVPYRHGEGLYIDEKGRIARFSKHLRPSLVRRVLNYNVHDFVEVLTLRYSKHHVKGQ